MSIFRNKAGIGSYAISLGSKVLRGGRMRKCGSQVVSYSPHVAELFGTASRAAIGGVIAMGAMVAAPAAMALPLGANGILVDEQTDAHINIVINADENASGTTNGVAAIAWGQGNIVVTNDGIVNGEDLSSDPTGAFGINAMSFGGGNIAVINNGVTLGQLIGVSAQQTPGASGEISVVNRGFIFSDGTGSHGINAASTADGTGGGDGDIVITNEGIVASAGIGVVSAHDRVGNITLNNSGDFGIAGQTGGVFIQQLYRGNVTINNSADIYSEYGNSVEVNMVSGSEGDVNIVNTGFITSEDEAAIRVSHAGTGDLTIDLQALTDKDDEYLDNAVSSTYGDAIVLNHDGEGDINITAAAGTNIYADDTAISIGRGYYSVGDINLNLAGYVESYDDDVIGISQYGVGDINVTLASTAEIYNDDYGSGLDLYFGEDSLGDILITTADGSEIDADYEGIAATHYGEGDITLNIAGHIESDYDDAISLDHSGRGDINVTLASTATIEGDEDGLFLYRNSYSRGTINVTTDSGSEIEAEDIGINVRNYGNGDITLNLAGDILTGYSDEEYEYRYDGDAGVYAVHYGRGDVNVDLAGSINSGGNGIELYSSNLYPFAATGDVNADITQSGSIKSSGTGIIAINYRVGDLSIENAGLIDALRIGIDANHQGVGLLNVANSGSILAANAGIVANHDGNGLLKVVNSGSIVAMEPEYIPYSMVSNAGIFGGRGTTGNIEITNSGAASSITGFEAGIEARHGEFGDITIQNAGSITGKLIEGIDGDPSYYIGGGINAYHYGEGNISIQNSGTILAGYDGIYASHEGLGNVTINNSGDITAGAGIIVDNEGYCSAPVGDVFVNSTGTITANDNGIGVWINDGAITINAHNVQGGEDEDYSAIFAATYSANDVTITTTGTVAGAYNGISAGSAGGNVNVTIGAGSVVQNITQDSADLAVELFSDYGVASGLSLTNNGTLTGAVAFYNGDNAGSEFINNGLWNNAGAINSFTSGEDRVTINGVWDARGSINYFSGQQVFTRMAVDPSTFEDVVTVSRGGELIVGGGSLEDMIPGTGFEGLDLLHVFGSITSNNDGAGDFTYIDGDIAFEVGSVLSVDAGDSGAMDLIQAGGTAIINGGTLQLTFVGESKPVVGDIYDAVQATEVVGTFDNTEIMNTAFRGWDIDYVEDVDSDVVRLTYSQLRTFEDLAQTANQSGVAAALAGLGEDSVLAEAVLESANATVARNTYNMLSGEIHPGVRTAVMEDSRLPRNAVLERLSAPQGGAIWGQTFYNDGSNDGQNANNTAKLDRESWGFMAGGDVPLGEDAVAGIAAAYVSADLDQNARAAKGKAETIHALAYVGGVSGNLSYKAGVGYAWGDIETTRTVAVGDFSNRLTADYNAKLFQGFAEVGVRLPLGGGTVEPIANITYLNAKTSSFAETGGEAALNAAKASESNTLTTVGTRFETAKTGIFSVNGLVGWQHAFGDLPPVNSFRLGNSDAFRVAGVAQSRDAAVAVVEGKFALSETTTLGVSYDGVLGSAGEDHAAKLTLRVKF